MLLFHYLSTVHVKTCNLISFLEKLLIREGVLIGLPGPIWITIRHKQFHHHDGL